MSILVVNGVAYQCQRGGHAAPRRVGTMPGSFAQRQTSSVRAELMVVPVILSYLTSAEAATLRTTLANGAQVTCSGDVFNNGGAAIVCSGAITDEERQGATWWEVSLTLYEIGSFSYDATIASVYLTNVASPDGGAGVNLATGDPAGDPFSAGLGSVALLNGVPITTCGGAPDPSVNCPIVYTDPGTPEKVWLTAATVANGWLWGAPVVSILSSGGTGDAWQTQASMAVIYVVRSGVDVATWTTGYSDSNGGFAGSTITMTGLDSVLFYSEIGDRFRIELFARAGLHGGYADSGDRQTVTFGNGGVSSHYGNLSVGGLVAVLDPTL